MSENDKELPVLTPGNVEQYFRSANLFNENGKWKYNIYLDYRGLDWGHWDLWSNAATAFRNATDRGLSDVTMREVPSGWSLVVLEPWGENSHPIMLRGKA